MKYSVDKATDSKMVLRADNQTGISSYAISCYELYGLENFKVLFLNPWKRDLNSCLYYSKESTKNWNPDLRRKGISKNTIIQISRDYPYRYLLCKKMGNSLNLFLNSWKNKWLDAFKRHAACCPEHLPPEVPTRPTARDRGFRNLKEAQRASRQSVMITNDTMYEEECIAGQLRVLMPVWETRYVTLCSNGAVQVFKVSFNEIQPTHLIDQMVVPALKWSSCLTSKDYQSNKFDLFVI